MKERNKVIFNAIVSILTGALGLIGITVIYFKYGSLCTLTVERHPDTYWFVFAFRIIFLMLCPILCFLLIMLGSHILYYFIKESKGVSLK